MLFKDKYGRIFNSEEIDEMTIYHIEQLSFHMEDEIEI